jgi:apolipoprotein N-acyltransferase
MDWRHSFLLRVLLSGSLLGIGFFIPWLWFVSFVGVLPLLEEEFFVSRHPLSLFGYGWLLGMVLYGIALWGFFWDTLPLTWYGIDSTLAQMVAVGGNWFLTAGSLSVGTGIFAIAMKYVWRNKISDLFIVPLVWVVGEQLGSYAFDVVFFGPGSLIGGHFTLGHVGYLLANDRVLLQLAWLGGIYLLSFFVMFVNMTFYTVIRTPQKKSIAIAICGIALTLYIGVYSTLTFLPHTESGGEIKVLAISRYIPAELHVSAEEGRARAEATLNLIGGEKADMLLLPEGAALTKYLTQDEFVQLQSQFPVIVDEQLVHDSPQVSFSRAMFLYKDGTRTIQEKEFPLPVGEYMPYLHRFVLNLLPAGFKQQVLTTRSIASGASQNFLELGSSQASVRFCNEVLSPFLYASDAGAGTEMFFNIASHGWFHGSAFVFSNMQNAAKVRAVESRRWYVQASNMSPAFAIDPYGRVAEESISGIGRALLIKVQPRSDRTPYQAIIHMALR